MSDPNCTIEWPWESYREIWLYDGTKGSPDDWQAFCIEVGHASQDAHTVADLDAELDRLAEARGWVAQVHPGPSHSDPVRNTLRVGVFVKGVDPPT